MQPMVTWSGLPVSQHVVSVLPVSGAHGYLKKAARTFGIITCGCNFPIPHPIANRQNIFFAGLSLENHAERAV